MCYIRSGQVVACHIFLKKLNAYYKNLLPFNCVSHNFSRRSYCYCMATSHLPYQVFLTPLYISSLLLPRPTCRADDFPFKKKRFSVSRLGRILSHSVHSGPALKQCTLLSLINVLGRETQLGLVYHTCASICDQYYITI